MKTTKTIFLISILIIISGGNLFSQQTQAKANSPVKVQVTRSVQELMSLITNFIMQTYELREGDYAKGDWNAVTKSKPPETSCSAQFTYAIARGINRGWLDASYIPVVKKSLAALSDPSRISVKGELLKVGASTSIGPDLAYYNARPVEAEDKYSHGSGLMLFALTEMNALLQNEAKSRSIFMKVS
jgi:rhamnogalacturonyl hydrolase YesR